MLLRTIFALVLLTALAESLIHGAHALAQTVVRRQALRAEHAQIDASITQARNAIADAIAAGADPASPNPSVPSPSATCRAATNAGCVLETSATIAFPPSSPDSQQPCPDGACTTYEQANDAVGEGRIDATIDALVTGSDGAVLTSRSTRATFRTMRVAPYALLSGQADASLDLAVQDAAGNDAGAAPIGAAPGTLIDVVYQNRSTGATLPASVWHAAVELDAGNAPAWSP